MSKGSFFDGNVGDETQVSNASTSAAAAATSATNAATSETNAAASATAASTAQTAAETAQTAAETALDNFDDVYLGAKASNPTLDNDGDALTAGDLYFNTTDDLLYYYTGTVWDSIASGGAVSLPVLDTVSIAKGNVDNTKQVRLEVDGLTTATTRVLTVQDSDGTIALDADVTNKLPLAGGALTGAVTTTSTFDGRDVATDGTKLDGIEASADVTDTTNVTAAGALMDSELADVAAVKATTGTFLVADQTKLDGIEASADVTDATNVDAAGAVMNSDATTSAMSFVVDEDNMVSDLATKVPTQQSVKAYVDTEVASAITSEMSYKGAYNASTNSPDLDTSPSGVAVGDVYTVTVAGTFFTTAVEVGDMIIAEVASASLEADWTIVNKNLDDASIKVAYENNADTNAFTDAEQTKVGHISVTQAVDLDTIESDTATNNAKVTNVTTDLSYAAGTRTVTSSDGTNAVLTEVVAAGNSGLMTGTDKTKLDGIEASADVTDTTNVTAAGALMDSELAGIAAVKATTAAFLVADETKLDGIDAIASKKSNLVATVAPTATDDSGSGYAVGSIWIDVTADLSYTCVDATSSAAIWSTGGGLYTTVTQHGAKGDNSTDDTTAINAAISAVNTAGGGTVFFPAGDYKVSQIEMKEDVRLLGESMNSVTIRANTNSKNVINYAVASAAGYTYDSYFAIEDLSIDGTGFTTINLINFAGNEDETVLTGTIDPTASTAVVGVGTLFSTEVAVGDFLVVSGETRVVTVVTDNTNLTVDNAFSDNANDTSPAIVNYDRVNRLELNKLHLTNADVGAVNLKLCVNTTIQAVDVEACKYGIYLDRCADSDVANSSVQNDMTVGATGFYVGGGLGAYDEGVRLVNCSTNGQYNGIHISGQDWGSLVGCSFTTTHSGGYALQTDSSSDWQISGCQFASGAGSGVGSNVLIQATSSKFVITGSFIAAGAFGLLLYGDDNTIVGNNFASNNNVDIWISGGSNVISSNRCGSTGNAISIGETTGATNNEFSSNVITGTLTPIAASDSNISTFKNKLDATTAPTSSEDSGDGYAVGSTWIDTTADTPYICVDSTAAAAVWQEVGAGGGGGDTLPVVDTTGIAKGSVDATKIARLEVDGLTTATTRVLTVQDSDGTIAYTSDITGTNSGTNTGDEVAASATVSGIVELATIAEVDTGTDTVRAITPAGLAGSALQTKVDAIEALADVTDTTNVTAAGALMDSEVTNLADVKAFATTDYATAAQGTTADNALPKAGGALTGAVTTTSTFDGRDVATDGTKLDGIEALADVTDTTNVTAAGALMDSEVTNLADVKAFATTDYATAAHSADTSIHLESGTGTTAPTANEDSGDGYAPGSMFVDTTADTAYICLDATSTAAVWQEVGAGGGSFTSSGTAPGSPVAGDHWFDSTNGILYIQIDSNWVDVSTAGAGLDAFTDTSAIVQGSADSTKKVRLEVDGLTTATTRVLTVQDSDGTIAYTSDITGTNSGTNTGDEVAASATVSGVVELATDAEMTTGTDTTRAITPANAKVELDKKLNLAGGTATGDITVSKAGVSGFVATETDASASARFVAFNGDGFVGTTTNGDCWLQANNANVIKLSKTGEAEVTNDLQVFGTTIVKGFTETQTTKAASFTPAFTEGTVYSCTGTMTITMPTATAGKSFTIMHATGTSITWAGTIKWSGGTEPTKDAGIDIYTFISDGTNWYGMQAGTAFA